MTDNHYPVDSVVRFASTYPLDSDLSTGQRYPPFDQPGPQLQVMELLEMSYLKETPRVCAGHGKPGKSWNFIISLYRPGKSWNFIISLSRPVKSWNLGMGHGKLCLLYKITNLGRF